MRIKKLRKILKNEIQAGNPVLLTGAPGIGKTDVVHQVAEELGYHMIVTHPVIDDPTDYKGYPAKSEDGKSATFLPFGQLQDLIEADKPTIFFLDDIGQAPVSVQAALMQLLLARKINQHKVSDKVVFVAATNRKQDRAGVVGMLEPVKSRFTGGIYEVEANAEDWAFWAAEHGMPHELIGFIQFKPKIITEFEPSPDLQNTASPRTVAAVGEAMKRGIDQDVEFHIFTGKAGEGFTREFKAYLDMYRKLPPLKTFWEKPDKAEVPEEPSLLYAVSSGLAEYINEERYDNMFQFVERLPKEHQVMFARLSIRKWPKIKRKKTFQNWISDNHIYLL